jgi:hypothetical protein
VRLPASPSPPQQRPVLIAGDPFSDVEAGRWLGQCALLGDGLIEIHVDRGIWQTVADRGQ